MSNPNLHTEKSQLSAVEKEFENTIRPKDISEFSGQQQIIENLENFYQGSKDEVGSIGSYFISWSSGFGKNNFIKDCCK